MRGNARSRAPIIIGTRKFPSVAGIDGTRKKNTMITPCMVKSLLYVSGATSPVGSIRFSRISTAKKPPTKNIKVIEIKYSSAMRLWSCVSSHDFTLWSTFR
jgi:hypothetical protein